MKTKIIISILAAAVLSACSSTAGSKCCKPKKDIALQMYSLRDDFRKDYEGTLKDMGKMGYTAVEIAGFDGNTFKFYGKTPEDFKKDIESLGMKVISSHARRPLSQKEIETGDYSESLAWWKKALDAHKRAGCKYVVDPAQKLNTMQDLKAYAKYFNEIGKLAKTYGISFGYHNHAHEFNKVGNVVPFDYMIQNTNPEYVFYQMDVYWVVRGQCSPVEYFVKYPNRFRLLHIKDHKELGHSGMVGFDAIFNNLPKSVEAIVVEVERYNYAPKVSVQKSFDYLNNSDFVPASYPKTR